jgi:hypothetical protein
VNGATLLSSGNLTLFGDVAIQSLYGGYSSTNGTALAGRYALSFSCPLNKNIGLSGSYGSLATPLTSLIFNGPLFQSGAIDLTVYADTIAVNQTFSSYNKCSFYAHTGGNTGSISLLNGCGHYSNGTLKGLVVQGDAINVKGLFLGYFSQYDLSVTGPVTLTGDTSFQSWQSSSFSSTIQGGYNFGDLYHAAGKTISLGGNIGSIGTPLTTFILGPNASQGVVLTGNVDVYANTIYLDSNISSYTGTYAFSWNSSNPITMYASAYHIKYQY